MRNKNLLWLTTTAVLLALIVVAQLIPVQVPPVKQLVTGSLVNLILIVATTAVGLWSGVALAGLSPFINLALGQLPAPVMAPVVAIGNIILVLIVWLFFRMARDKSNGTQTAVNISGIVLAAVLKCAFLWSVTAGAIAPLLAGKAAQAKIALLINMMSWPQAVAAVIGGLIALAVLPPVRRFLRVNNQQF
ncbi:MAG: ECF transporter S component [Clostridia bacterium]|nr:ECF transporter S component [Clostridia bacterium]MDR3644566.1 ECF transporter S component [Clostridia bacterium]